MEVLKRVALILLLATPGIGFAQSGTSYDNGPAIIGLVSSTGANPYTPLTTTGTSGQAYDYSSTTILLGYNSTTKKYYACGTANPCSGAGSGGGGGTAAPTKQVIAGTSVYPYTTEQGGSSIDTVQGYKTFFVPTGAAEIQVEFDNAGGSNEGCGPQVALRAAFSNGPYGYFIPIYFSGRRDAIIDGCAKQISDALAMLPSNVQTNPIQIAYKVTKTNLSDSTSFFAGWQFNNIYGNTVLAPFTTPTAGGLWDAVEELKTRTVTDGVANGTTTVTSATASFQPQDIGQTVTIGGTARTISAVNSGTSVNLSSTVTTATGLTMAITPTDKTTAGVGAFYYSFTPVTAYAPHMLIGKTPTSLPSVGICCDSISSNITTYGASATQGSWSTQALNQAGIAASKATLISVAYPYNNEAMPGADSGSYAGFQAPMRYGHLAFDKYVLGLVGINDVTEGQTATQIEQNLLTIAGRIYYQPGTKPFFGTILPHSTSSDGFATVANQTVTANESVRVAVNTWIRDGGPMDCTTGGPAATGTTGATITRAAFYTVAGAVVTAATAATATTCANNSMKTNPMAGGWFELANTVESAQNSGKWQAPNFTSDGLHPLPATHALMGTAVAPLVTSLFK